MLLQLAPFLRLHMIFTVSLIIHERHEYDHLFVFNMNRRGIPSYESD